MEQDTRHWNEQKGVTISMRSKEDAEDYRYFPDPDLVPVVLTEEQIESVARRSCPSLPGRRRPAASSRSTACRRTTPGC